MVVGHGPVDRSDQTLRGQREGSSSAHTPRTGRDRGRRARRRAVARPPPWLGSRSHTREGPLELPITTPVDPVRTTLTRDLPGGGHLYEPGWQGRRCLVLRDGDELELQGADGRSLTRFLPELPGPLRRQLPAQVVLDGTLLVPDGAGVDVDAIDERLSAPPDLVGELGRRRPARFVACDVLAVGDHDCTGVRTRDRRDRLAGMLAHAVAPLHLTPATTDAAVAGDWLERFRGAGVDGIVAKPLHGTYEAGRPGWSWVRRERTAAVVVGGFRWHHDGHGVGSLLLGLYDDAGELRPVGTAGAFPAARRRELVAELDPHRDGAAVGHPWLAAGHVVDVVHGSRRGNDGDGAWEPLRPELVAEVAYERLRDGHLPGLARWCGWRPDREPRSCTLRQLGTATPDEVRALLAT